MQTGTHQIDADSLSLEFLVEFAQREEQAMQSLGRWLRRAGAALVLLLAFQTRSYAVPPWSRNIR
ncbi:hypothetical protein BCO71171_00417 [Burkholderia contaminans]|uniref:Uncharacterized protein n=1 Tax=Burkholderia contaminans TaxID=488447 RepID=A0A6P2VJ28_9BURK|nr:hypothetical protein BCO71171_00417 [Burkholderia contaminans]